MNGISLQQAQTQLGLWLKANEAVCQGQSYTIASESSSRTLTRVNSKEILQQVEFWDGQIKRLSRVGNRIRRVVIE